MPSRTTIALSPTSLSDLVPQEIGKDFFHDLGVQDALGSKVELFGRGGAQTFLNAHIQNVRTETLSKETRQHDLPALMPLSSDQSFREIHYRTLLVREEVTARSIMQDLTSTSIF